MKPSRPRCRKVESVFQRASRPDFQGTGNWVCLDCRRLFVVAELNGQIVNLALLGMDRVVKTEQGGRWALTSTKGTLLATFTSEEELDTWWEALQLLRKSRPS